MIISGESDCGALKEEGFVERLGRGIFSIGDAVPNHLLEYRTDIAVG